MILLAVVILLAGCAGAGLQPPPAPDGEPLTIDQPEHRVRLHHWQVGDNFRYEFERYVETTAGDHVGRRRTTHDIRYSGRRATVQGGVQVGVFVDSLEVLLAFFDAATGLVDTTTSSETADLVVPLMRFWSVFAKHWDNRVLRPGVADTMRLPRRSTLAFDVRGESPPELSDDLDVTTQLTGYRRVAGQQTAVIVSKVANVVLRPARIRVGRRMVNADHISSESTYHVDTARGFLVASYTVTTLTGVVGGEPFTHRAIDVLRWKP